MEKRVYREMVTVALVATALLAVILWVAGYFAYVRIPELNAVVHSYLSTLPVLLLSWGIVALAVVLISKRLAKKVVRPLTGIVSQLQSADGYAITTEYVELQPIANAVRDYSKSVSEQRDRINVITDNMVEGMVILDDRGVVVSVNRSAIKILNPNFVLQGRSTFRDLTDQPTLLSAIDNVQVEKDSKVVLTIDDNHYRAYVHWAENIHGTILLLVDITETVKAEEVRHDFSANVSHELKTPLTTIKGFGELFENGLLTDVQDVKRYGAMIERESERLLFLINDIIRLSEIEEKTEKVLSPIDLYDSTEYAINLLSQKAQSKDISITLNGPKSIVVDAHDGYMNELLINLIDNAIKYNKDGGSIEITLSESSDKVTISVADTGIGISQQDCERIFERFYRVDKSHSKKIGGTGLGLSIVKHIVNYHDGEIHVQSELGVGTTISIDIPKADKR